MVDLAGRRFGLLLAGIVLASCKSAEPRLPAAFRAAVRHVHSDVSCPDARPLPGWTRWPEDPKLRCIVRDHQQLLDPVRSTLEANGCSASVLTELESITFQQDERFFERDIHDLGRTHRDCRIHEALYLMSRKRDE